LQDKSTCARTSTENVGGAYTRRGAYMRDAMVVAHTAAIVSLLNIPANYQ